MSKNQPVIEHILPLETENLLFGQKILSLLQAGESLTALWVAHGGRRKALTFLAQNADFFGFQKLGRYQLVYLDSNFLTQNNPESYFQLMLNILNPQIEHNFDKFSPFFCLKKEVEEKLAQGSHFIFILSGFEDLDFPASFFNNLKALWQLNKKKVSFIFGTTKNIFSPDVFKKYDQLREVLSQNLVYFPLFDPAQADFVFDYLAKKYDHKVSLDTKETILSLCGGHPALIRACLRIFSQQNKPRADIFDFLSHHFEIKMILEDLWQSLDAEEKQAILEKKDYPLRLLNLRIINSDKNLFSPLFEAFVKNQNQIKKTLKLDVQTEELLINNQPVKEKFSLKEYDLLVYFLKNQNKVVSRDQLGDVLWADKAYDNYSDWAIDQLISQLRKKLGRLGLDEKVLQTVRNRGYVLKA